MDGARMLNLSVVCHCDYRVCVCILFSLPNAQLQSLLSKNRQSKSGTKDVLIARILENSLLGNLPRCSKCSKGTLFYAVSQKEEQNMEGWIACWWHPHRADHGSVCVFFLLPLCRPAPTTATAVSIPSACAHSSATSMQIESNEAFGSSERRAVQQSKHAIPTNHPPASPSSAFQCNRNRTLDCSCHNFLRSSHCSILIILS